MKRTTKNGRDIKAAVKSFLVVLNEDVKVGKLNKRGANDIKMFATVVPKKEIEAGTKLCLRVGIKKFNGNYLVYAHGYGWIEVENMEKTFTSKDTNYETMLESNYTALSNKEKIQLIEKYYPNHFKQLTKTETLLMAYYNNLDLNEVESQISCDKSLKYKIKNHTDKYAVAMLKKIELLLD